MQGPLQVSDYVLEGQTNTLRHQFHTLFSDRRLYKFSEELKGTKMCMTYCTVLHS